MAKEPYEDEEIMAEEDLPVPDDPTGAIRDAIANKLAQMLPEGVDPDQMADELLADPAVQDILGLPTADEAIAEDDVLAEADEMGAEGAAPPPAEEVAVAEEEVVPAGAPVTPQRGESNSIRAMREKFAKK